MADTRFDNMKYVYWLKVCMALIFAKEGLEKLTDELVKAFHDRLKRILGNKVCSLCSKDDLIKQWRTGRWQCKTNVCGKWLDEIKAHLSSMKTSIEWDNSDISYLPTSAWDCLKLYMPFGSEAITGAAKCDIAAILSLFINNSFFIDHIGGPVSSNYFEKVKEIRNTVMHSSNLELEETHVDKYMDAIMAMLQCHTTLASDEKCKDAITKIQDIRLTKLEVSLHKEYELRSLNARLYAAERKLDQSHSHFKDDMEKLKASTIPTMKVDVDTKYRTLHTEYQDVKQEVDKIIGFFSVFLRENEIQNIDLGRLTEKANTLNTLLDDMNVIKSDIIGLKHKQKQQDHKITKLQSQIPIKKLETMTYEDRKKELQRYLIELYKNDHSSMSVYPLKPHLTRKLDEMYVTPEMVEKNPRGQTKPQPDLADRLEHTKGQSDRKIGTLNDVLFKNGKLCKNIYVTGEAGIGKSTFCKYIVRMWLRAHSNQTENTSSDSEVMKQFSLLFYVQLRGVILGTETGELANLIKKQLNLNDGLENFYSDDNSLIILDSLDEIASGLPFRGDLDKSTRLTTSRPWKLEASRDNTYGNKIDRQVEIVCIGETSAETLVQNLLPVLAEESANDEFTNVSERDSQSFITEIKNKNLVSFFRIPVLLIQCLCLWYDDNLAEHESQSSIYKQLLCYQIKLSKISRKISQDKYKLLRCKSLKCPCNNFSDIVVKLGKLAFNALVSENRENELIFDHNITKMHGLSKEDVDICLKIGCLSKHKLFGKITDDPKMYVSFVHKTNQEYFASIYLAYKVSKIKSVLKSAIGNLDKMLELEKVLMFVSGLHPEKGKTMATLLLAAVKADPRVLEYRQTAARYSHDDLISNVQNAILAAMEECWRSNKRQLNLPLMDIVVNNKNMSSVSSFLVSRESPIASILIKGKFGSNIPADNLFTLFNTSRLQKVALSWCTISGATVTQFISRSLCALYLGDVRMSHADLSGLCSQLAAAENLREVKLFRLECETHGKLHDGRCVGLSLDLGGLTELRELIIVDCDVSALVLSPHMSHLQRVYLYRVTTTAAIVRKLVDSLPRNNVEVILCDVTIRHEVDAPSPDAILDNIRRSCTVVDYGVERKENGDLFVKWFRFRYKQDGEFRVRRNLCKIV